MRSSLILTGVTVAVLAILSVIIPAEGVITAQAQDNVPVVPDGFDAEAKFLEELHYSHEDFIRIYNSLPRDEENKVDWERAVEEGLIEPAASIGDDDVEELLMDLRVVIKFNDMLIKDVVFSHEVHTYWLNCDSCHPKLFNPEVESNHMTMKEMREGKYCGHCHGMVAFPTNIIDAPNFRANCLRCHRAQRG